MIDRAGASFPLSIAIVVLATIILHRVEATGDASPVAKMPDGVGASHALGELTKSTGLASPSGPDKPPLAAPATLVRKSDIAASHASFTRAEAGETLSDVAHRVYGQDANVRAVWDLNRDQVADVAVPLERGLLLRTPEL